MSLWLLITILYDCFKNSCIWGHDCWLEDYFYVMILMRRNFYLFGIYLKSKLFNRVRSLLSDIKFYCTSNFVAILYFNLLNNSLRHFRRHKSPKIEYSLLDEKHIRFYKACHIGRVMLTWHNKLLLENRLKATSIDSWNAWLGY